MLSPSNSSFQRYGESLELLAFSLELLVVSLEDSAVCSLEQLPLVAEEDSAEGISAEELLAVSSMASFDEDDSMAGASAEDKFVSLEGVVCSLISVLSALEEVSEEQATAKKATPAQREKRLIMGDFMP